MTSVDLPHLSSKALLTSGKKEGRGHFKVFLGAAPGVGKTCAMLAAAHVEKRSGREVVIGFIRTHARAETEAMVDGLEVLPHKSVPYKNRLLPEFDVDAALARGPHLLLVDELAHTNFPGGRNPKRWNDIEELLAAGINVWTTLNVQHLESVNDVVQRITNIRVHNTVPDRTFEEADEIVLVDLSPDELMKRLTEGKIYSPHAAAHRTKIFREPENLHALRQLALRRAAERININLSEPTKGHAIEGPWGEEERILACVGSDALSTLTVRTAKRLAELMHAPWMAVTVEAPGGHLDETERRRAREALKLAKDLGAKVEILVGNDVPAEILRFSKFENVTQIVIGRSNGGIWTELFSGSLSYELIRRADDKIIHLVAGHDKPSSWLPHIGRRWLPADLAKRIAARRKNSIGLPRKAK